MNKSLNKKGIAMLSVIALLGFSSCINDLDRTPTNITTGGSITSSEESLKQALAKVYGAFSITGNEGPAGQGDVAGIDEGFSDFFRNFFNLQELPTDEAISSWSDDGLPDLHNLNWSSSNPFVKGLYYRSLFQIKLVANFLDLTKGQVADPTVKTYRAEARFLRAFQYWVLIDLFGNPPIVDEALGTGKVSPMQFTRPELFKYIESELLSIEQELLAPRANEYGRVDRAAAWALLSRLYLNAEVYTGQEQYAKAAEYAERVINSGYKLEAKYAHLFGADNNVDNTETIFSIGYDGTYSKNYGGMTFLINGSTSADVQTTLGVNMGIDGGWGGNRATSALDALFADKSKDSRYMLGYTTKDIAKVSDFKQGVWVTKFRNVKRDGSLGSHNTFADTDFPLFRLSEMYLNYAEAAIRGKANIAQGLEYLNLVRERAFGDKSGNYASLPSAEELLAERGRELYWECLRRTDLIRFDLLTSAKYVWPWKGGVAEGRSVSEHYRVYPLPADDVQANGNLKQNPNY